MNKKIIVAGSRDMDDYQVTYACIMKAAGKIYDRIEIVTGLALGPDLHALTFAKEHLKPYAEFPADWKNIETLRPCKIKHGKYGPYNALAGINRNHDMGDYTDALIAIWDGKSTGTKDMIDYMFGLGKPVVVFYYEVEDGGASEITQYRVTKTERLNY